jgi:hypothetical protein
MPRDRYDDEDDYDRPRRRDDDYDDRPRRSRRRDDDDYDRSPPQKGNGFAVASLVLGLVSICLGPVTGLIGAILGFVGLGKPTGKGMATTGVVLNLLFSLLGTAGIIYGYMRIQETGEKMKSSNNLKQMGLASHNYYNSYGTLQQPYVKRPTDLPGQMPSDLDDRLGWRVTLLPYAEEDYLYKRFDLSQPWNGGPNQPLSSIVVKAYADPDTPTDPTTRYRCFYDNGAVFDTRQSVALPGITDGTSNTILYVEGGEKVTWTRFQEYKFDPNGPLPALGHPKRDVFQAVMADGSVRSFRKSMNPSTLKAAITRNGGEVVLLDD